MVTARVVTKNKSTAVKRKYLHGWLFKEFCVVKANERHKCISKCCSSVKMSMSLRYRACWACISGSCCWLPRNQRASSNYSTINAAAGDQTKGETSSLGVKFSGWHQKLGLIHLRIKRASILLPLLVIKDLNQPLTQAMGLAHHLKQFSSFSLKGFISRRSIKLW